MLVKNSRMLLALTISTLALSSYAQNKNANSEGPYWYYLSSSATSEVFRIEQDTGLLIDKLSPSVPGAFASFASSDSDYYVAASTSAEIYRFDKLTAQFKDVFVKAHSGGLVKPIIPTPSPDGKYLFVNDLATQSVLRFNGNTGEFIDLFAGPALGSPLGNGFMPVFSPFPEHAGKLFITSANTHSVQMYDTETKAYLGDFVPPGSGGLITPIGSVFGPDGNLYLSDIGTDSIKRYDGRTGDYIDDFVPPKTGGLLSPRAIDFGGSNSDLHVVSVGTNQVLKFDRTTGKSLGVSSDGKVLGYSEARGLMFSARPNLYALASPAVVDPDGSRGYANISVEFLTAKGKLDGTEKVSLVSVANDDRDSTDKNEIRGADIGTDDRNFWIKAKNNTSQPKTFTATYKISKPGQASALTTTKIKILPAKKCSYKVEYQNDTSFLASIRITNTTDYPINGWNINWQYADGSQIFNVSNAKISGKNPYYASNTKWNPTIKAGDSAEFLFLGKKNSLTDAEVPLLKGSVCE